MRKFLFTLVIACLAFGAQAQIIQSTSSKSTIRVVPEEKKSEDWNHSSAFIETGIGVTAGDCVNDFGWTVGIGYRWHIAQGVLLGYNQNEFQHRRVAFHRSPRHPFHLRRALSFAAVHSRQKPSMPISI